MPGTTGNVPADYLPPTWPSLYWPIRPAGGTPNYLYYTTDIWRFTLFWTLLFYGTVYICAAVWAVLMQLRSALARSRRARRLASNNPNASAALGSRGNALRQTLAWVWIVPHVYCVIGAIEALMAGSILGLVLGAVYSAGYYKMSTWTPFLWGLINVLVIILASFSIQGGL